LARNLEAFVRPIDVASAVHVGGEFAEAGWISLGCVANRARFKEPLNKGRLGCTWVAS